MFDAANRRAMQALRSGTAPTITYAITQYSYLANNLPDCVAQRMNPAVFGTIGGTSACTPGTTGTQGPDRIVKTLYDNADRPTTVQEGLGTPQQRDGSTMTYTGNGNIATLSDAKNNRTTYEYDSHDRLSKTRYPSPTVAETSSTTDYEQPTYDCDATSCNSLVTAMRLRDGQSIGFAYDDLSRLTLKTLPGSEAGVTYGYDLLGRMTLASQTGHALSFTYDALSRNLTQVGPLGTVTSTWDIGGRRTRLDLPGGYYTTYDYLVTGETTAIRESGAVSGVGVLATFGYDDLGNRTSLTRGNGTVTSYTPDAVSRLSSLTQNLAATVSDQTIGLGYNAASQIATRSSSNDIYAMRQQYNANRGYSVNGLNQYLTAGTAVPTYDARGNLTGQGTSSFTYSSENLLKSATLSSGASTLSYDPAMRLAQTSGSATTRFLYDGTDLVAEYDGAGTVVLRRYVHGPGADEPLVWYEGSGTSDRRWLHADERGSIIAVTNGSGNAISTNAYDEWGNPQSGNLGRFGYTGQTWLPEIGLWYYKARMYNPRLGRFMQTDPIGYGDGMNWYGYVGGDPINNTDPSGLAGDCPSGTLCGTYDGPDIVVTARPSSGTSINVVGLVKAGVKLLSKAPKIAKKAYCGTLGKIFGGCKKKKAAPAPVSAPAAVESQSDDNGGCIPSSAGPVYIDQSYGFDIGLGVGAGFSASHFRIPSTGDSGWVASGSFLGGAGIGAGGSVGVVDTLGGLLGEGYRMSIIHPVPGVGAEWSFGDDGKVNGISAGPALGVGAFGGKTKTKVQSSTRPPC